MNTIVVLTASLFLSVTICASHVSGRLASHAPSAEFSESVALTRGSEDPPPPAPPVSGVEHDE